MEYVFHFFMQGFIFKKHTEILFDHWGYYKCVSVPFYIYMSLKNIVFSSVGFIIKLKKWYLFRNLDLTWEIVSLYTGKLPLLFHLHMWIEFWSCISKLPNTRIIVIGNESLHLWLHEQTAFLLLTLTMGHGL